jgi:hypothetical protein
MIEMDKYRDLIESALAYSGGTHDYGDVVDAVIAGRMQIWPAPRGVAITEIIEYPRKKALHVFLAAGEMDQLIAMVASAEAWGFAQGCKYVTMAGRKGWSRVLAKHGWSETMAVMQKEIAA